MSTRERAKRAESARGPRDSATQDIYDLMMPQREGPFDAHEQSAERMDGVYDEVSIIEAEEFASRMANGIVPASERFMELSPGIDSRRGMTKSELREERALLSDSSDEMFDELTHAGFFNHTGELMTDIGIGNACLLFRDGDARQPLRPEAVPSSTVYFDHGPFGGLDGVFRFPRMTWSDFYVLYPKAKKGVDNDVLRDRLEQKGKVKFVEGCHRDWEELGTEKFVFEILGPDDGRDDTPLVRKEYKGRGSKPWVTPRWSASSVSPYGWGPFRLVLPAVRQVNLLQDLLYQNMAMAVSGIWSYPDDGAVNVDAIKLLPGTVVPAGIDGGLEQVRQDTKLEYADLSVDKLHQRIRRGLYAEEFGDLEKTPRSAQEIVERQRAMAARIGMPVVRMTGELVTQLGLATQYRLRKFGKLTGLESVTDGRDQMVYVESPLYRLYMMSRAQNFERFTAMGQAIYGQAYAGLLADSALDELSEMYNIDPALLKNEGDRKAFFENAAQAAAGIEGGVNE